LVRWFWVIIRLRASGAGRFAVAPNQTALLFIRPNDIEIAAEGAHENVLEGVVKQATYLGETMDYRVEVSAEVESELELRVQTSAAHRFAKGARVRLYLPAERLRVIGEE
jgi:ABC-type Fe3+/spermidine/putrescine transport system ATPase subunit